MKAQSPAMQLLTLVWDQCSRKSWTTINLSMRSALVLAIRSGMDFDVGDFADCAKFRWGYWAGSDMEYIYTDAVISENASCIAAWEVYAGRKAFVANDVHCNSNRNYLHTQSISRARCRLAVGFSFSFDGKQWVVNGFNDDKGTVRVAFYKRNRRTPTLLKQFTHQEITGMFPAPKRAKSGPAVPGNDGR